jgi:3',5'-cyclic AMP phosphodiesterase CpdA
MNPAKSEDPSPGSGYFMSESNSVSGDALTFAQLSDPHLSSPATVKFYQLLNKRVLGYLSWRLNRRHEHSLQVLDSLLQDMGAMNPDHVVVTGDLTHLGLPQECQQVGRWLETVGKPFDVTVIPGNHDTYVPASWQKTLGLWEPYMASDQPTTTGSEHVFPSLRIWGPVAFIGLSSAHPSPPFMAVGSLGETQLKRLAELLEQARQQKLFRVVMVHHAPIPASDKWRKRLTDSVDLCRVLSKHGVELVLHGHTHRVMDSELSTAKGMVPVIGIPSASALGLAHRQPARYHLYKVARGQRGWDLAVSIRGYMKDKASFEAISERHLQLPEW